MWIKYGKMASKQKLKDKIRELHRQLSVLATQPDSEEARVIKTTYKLLADFEKTVWTGSVDIKRPIPGAPFIASNMELRKR